MENISLKQGLAMFSLILAACTPLVVGGIKYGELETKIDTIKQEHTIYRKQTDTKIKDLKLDIKNIDNKFDKIVMSLEKTSVATAKISTDIYYLRRAVESKK